MDLTKLAGGGYKIDQSKTNEDLMRTMKSDQTGLRHISGFKKDARLHQNSTSVHDILQVKRSKSKRQFIKANSENA
jgi:hypothetical protein